jgi:hypothetical protein
VDRNSVMSDGAASLVIQTHLATPTAASDTNSASTLAKASSSAKQIVSDILILTWPLLMFDVVVSLPLLRSISPACLC